MPSDEIHLDFLSRVEAASGGGAAETQTSAASATTNAFQLRWRQLAYDAAGGSEDMDSWIFPVPVNYSSGGTLVVQWFSDVATGNVLWKASIYVATASSSDIDTSAAFNTVENFALESVPTTIGQFKTSAIALNSPGLAAGRWAIVMFGRDNDDPRDSAAGDVNLLSARFAYTVA